MTEIGTAHLTNAQLEHMIVISERELGEHERAGRTRAAKTRRRYHAELLAALAHRRTQEDDV